MEIKHVTFYNLSTSGITMAQRLKEKQKERKGNEMENLEKTLN